MSAGNTLTILVAVLLLGLTATAVPGHQPPAIPTPPFKEVATQPCSCGAFAPASGGAVAGYQPAGAAAPAASYDEQLGISFTQDFTSLAYNVTAVEQQDPTTGFGPAYLLNGLSDAGLWYQVGLSWNWNPGAVPGKGFDMNYEVFSQNGNSIFPTGGGGGLLALSGPVDQGDSVLLNLFFNSSEVVMLVHDWDTGASASVTFSAQGATSFVGSPSAVSNSQGFFTGLMTEWYRSSVYTGNEQEVAFTDKALALSSAWLWMDEYNPNDLSGGDVFSNQTSSPVSFSASPAKLVEFATNGATEYASATEFITGALSSAQTVPLTIDYAVHGGGSGYSPPVLSYVSGGKTVNATLTTSPAMYNVDTGTTWSVTSTLAGSTTGERWKTAQPTSGTATAAETTSIAYYHQFAASVTYSIVGSPPPLGPDIRFTSFGTETTPLVGNGSGTILWMDAGSSYFMTNSLSSPSQQERWEASGGTNGTVAGPISLAPVYYQQYLLEASYTAASGSPAPTLNYSEFGTGASVVLTGSPQAVWADAGSNYALPPVIYSGTQERWQTNSTGGTVTAPLEVSPNYQEQFYVALSPSSAGAGTVSPASGWYDAGATLNETASANAGWKFEYWQDVNGGTAASSMLEEVTGPVNETAVFFPGLTISAGSDVSVSYSNSGGGSATSGNVQPGTKTTIYVPPGGVLLTATPSSLFYSFSGWSGASSSGSQTISLTVTSPETVSAGSSLSYLVLGLFAVIAVAVVVAIAALASRGRRKSVGSPAA